MLSKYLDCRQAEIYSTLGQESCYNHQSHHQQQCTTYIVQSSVLHSHWLWAYTLFDEIRLMGRLDSMHKRIYYIICHKEPEKGA